MFFASVVIILVAGLQASMDLGGCSQSIWSHQVLSVKLKISVPKRVKDRLRYSSEISSCCRSKQTNISVKLTKFSVAFLVGAFSLKEKSPTITVGSFFSRRFSREKCPTLTVASF